jgi:hypothetical protein
MFTEADRDGVLKELLGLAEKDDSVVAAAVTGSLAHGGDAWSDIDLGFGVAGDLGPVMDRWTRTLYADFGAIHHWDLPSGSSIYRVFLLPGCLEADIAFTPAADFGPRGPAFRQVFADAVPADPVPANALSANAVPSDALSADAVPAEARPAEAVGSTGPSIDVIAGHGWHHVLHARICIERGKPWQAEYWISAVRDQTLTLACLRSGLPTDYAKGADALPPDLTDPLRAALVHSLDEPELRRALQAATTTFTTELARTDPTLATRLTRSLEDLAR